MFKTAIIAALCCVVFSFNAEARQRHHHHHRHHAVAATYADPGCNVLWPCEGVTTSARGERIVRGMGGFGTARKVYAPKTTVATPRPRQARQVASRVLPLDAGSNWGGKPQFKTSRNNINSLRVASYRAAVVAHPSGCPSRAFCGCGAAVRVFGHSVRELWLAANWFRFPRAAPGAGMVAVRRHHVFVLEQHLGGDNWQVFDANSGHHATQVHARSIAGYTIVNPHA